MTKLDLSAYRNLIRGFTDGRVDAAAFHSRYLELFKNESRDLDQATYQALNELFYVVESYVADPELRDDEDADDEALRAAAEKALVEIG